MADTQSISATPPHDRSHRRTRRRRRLMVAAAMLLAVVLIGVSAIWVMLERLEARTASFQPPMTSLERERLLPSDPVLEAPTVLDTIRYGDKVGTGQPTLLPVQGESILKPGPLDSRILVRSDERSSAQHSHSSNATQ